GAVDADDAEVLGPDLLDAGVQGAGRLVDLMPARPAVSPAVGGDSHGMDLHAGADGSVPILARKSGRNSGLRFLPQIGHIPGGYSCTNRLKPLKTREKQPAMPGTEVRGELG